MRQKRESNKRMKPIQSHYGLEFALAHMDDDLSIVFKALEKGQRRNKNGK